jgi:hypothetical protein
MAMSPTIANILKRFFIARSFFRTIVAAALPTAEKQIIAPQWHLLACCV